ncbi:MAG: penicillin-binding protein 2 [Clostridia bacterium]|jgi:penicillin-binding protein 2|nr:penicillin-binding protein 2 [Clostridia bacterium]
MNMNKRIHYILGVSALLFVFLFARTAYLQLWDSPDTGVALAEKALKYRTQVISAEEYYRGEILDRNLLSLTDSQVKPALIVFPSSINDLNALAKALSVLIEMTPSEISTRIKREQDLYGSRTPVIVKTNLTEGEIQQLQSSVIAATAVIPMKIRYGENSLARHIVGYLNRIDSAQWQELRENKKTTDTNSSLPTAYKITDNIGVSGLEGKYEEVLRGSRSQDKILGLTDANGKLLPGLGYKRQNDSSDPWRNHLVLTLDKRYQGIVERVMDEQIIRGAVVVLDIASGDILAVASRPNFEQNKIEKYLDGRDELIDRTSRVAFYPGSVFKMTVAAGVLEEGLVAPGEKFNCTGVHEFNDGTVISCLRPHGEVNMEEAVSRSCNTTFVQLGQRLGNAKFYEYASRLGFTVNINTASPPALLGNASIGQQGVLVSPLQIANLYATIARDGRYRPTRLLSSIRNYQGDLIYEYPNQPAVQAISTETAKILQKALVSAVQSGSGLQGWLDGYGTAGKTGTAQTNNTDKVIAWFAGYTPVDTPRLAIAVMVEENAAGAFTGLRGGDNAAPVFKEIAEEILALENILENES